MAKPRDLPDQRGLLLAAEDGCDRTAGIVHLDRYQGSQEREDCWYLTSDGGSLLCEPDRPDVGHRLGPAARRRPGPLSYAARTVAGDSVAYRLVNAMTASGSPDLPLVTLEDLPERRREALLWRYALTLDYAGVDAHVRARSRRPCGWQWLEQADKRVAVLGDDDRYHLLVDGQLVCVQSSLSSRRGLRNPPAAWRHEQWCHWWTDGTRYLIRAPRGAVRERTGAILGTGGRPVRWSVVLTDRRLDPSQVPTDQRCPIAQSWGQWPLPENQAGALGRVRIRLIEALGSDCHACRRRPGVLVDHDPFTTHVRGLLCRHCNTHIDTCPHPRGCPWADYLNDPPAAALKLVYPSWRNVLEHQSTKRKIEMLGIDPFAELRSLRPGTGRRPQ